MKSSATKKPFHTESFPLYSQTCLEYLQLAVELAKAKDEETSFAKYYEAPPTTTYVSSDDDNALNDDDDDDDMETTDEEGNREGGEDESAEVDNNKNRNDDGSSPKTLESNKPSSHPKPKQKEKQKKPMNQRERDEMIRQLGIPQMEEFALLDTHKVLCLPSCLLTKSEKLSSNPFIQTKAYLELAKSLLNDRPVLVLLLRSGRYAAGVFSKGRCIHHTTSTRYTIRKGQGKAQSAQDGKRRPKSMGSQLRRAGEEALRQDVRKSLENWKKQLTNSALILLSVPKAMMKGFYEDSVSGLIGKDDGRIRKVPLDVGRPTYEAVCAVYEIMMRGELYDQSTLRMQEGDGQGNDVGGDDELGDEKVSKIEETKESQAEETTTEKEVEKDMIPLSRLHELASTANLSELLAYLEEDSVDVSDINRMAGEDYMTPLHYAAAAAASGTVLEEDSSIDPSAASACVTALLLQGHADPTIQDARCRTPYFLATHEKVRDAFRMARAALGEEYCRWDEDAKVGPPLTEDDIKKKKQKAAEKKRRQRQRAKEKKAKEKAHAEAMEKQRQAQEEEQKQQEDAKRIRDGLQPRVSKATNVCDFCQKVCKGKKRSQMLQRLDYVYCSTACVQDHKRELMAAAALKRFGQ